jgi:hypothetical protein
MTPPVVPRAGDKDAPLAANPTGALACLTNEPADKRAVIGPGTQLPASVAVVLARLIDRAVPADETAAKSCAPTSPVLLTRFGYTSGAVDVIVSIACSAGHVAYVHDRAYLLPALLASYLEGATGTVLLQEPTLDHQVEVVVAVHPSPPCLAGQLAIQYLPGGAGAGNDFGTILLRNTSGSWCELDGPAAVTGLTAGHPVTHTLGLAVASDVELSPHAAAAIPGQAVPAHELIASLSLSAGYRDDADGSMCNPHWVVPTTWRLALSAITLTVANGRATADVRPPGAGGLITCRGQFRAGPIRLATS